MTEGSSNEVLLIASELLGETLSLQLKALNPNLDILTNKDQMTRQPCLVIWSIESLEAPWSIQIELQRLQNDWRPAPLLLLLPAKLKLNALDLLQLDCPGMLQDPDLITLGDSINTLLGGGRVVRLQDEAFSSNLKPHATMGLGQWLLFSGLQQISNDLQILDLRLKRKTKNGLFLVFLKGRARELRAAKSLLLWLWGPLKVVPNKDYPKQNSQASKNSSRQKEALQSKEIYGTNINLKERNSIAVWEAINVRLNRAIKQGINNSTGGLMAIEGLNPQHRRELLLALLDQLNQLINKLRLEDKASIVNSWLKLQTELREQSVREMAGSYVRLPGNNESTKSVADQLLETTDLQQIDDELANSLRMLDPLLLDKPLLVDGQFLPVDNPRALIQLEILISDWLIRNSELISGEILSASAERPLLRRYLLNQELISTRELERLRNQLNSETRWKDLIQRPIRMYESKKLLFRFHNGSITTLIVTEPRDEELRQLSWLQQQVALLIEARDALSPQVQAFIKTIGNLMVVLLTKVVGRAIGLVGRGIAQGMGRSLSRG